MLSVIMLSVIMLKVFMLSGIMAKTHYSKFNNADRLYAESHFTECYDAD
jgi:hypothetical protein